MKKVIQPFIFEKPLEYPNPIVDNMYLQRIILEPPKKEVPDIIEEPKHNNIVEDRKPVNINIDNGNKDKPFGIKFDLGFVDIEIHPKLPNIFKFIENLF